uniref:Uncharacterized protein n=1 Tax=Arundo donax TaxID=35708 RepID=A0A0A9DS66_ARUDO
MEMHYRILEQHSTPITTGLGQDQLHLSPKKSSSNSNGFAVHVETGRYGDAGGPYKILAPPIGMHLDVDPPT